MEINGIYTSNAPSKVNEPRRVGDHNYLRAVFCIQEKEKVLFIREVSSFERCPSSDSSNLSWLFT